MTDGRTDGGDCNFPIAFFIKKRGDNKGQLQNPHKQWETTINNEPTTELPAA